MAIIENDDNHRQRNPPPQSVRMLPTEMVNEILLKLPVESLLRCKSVCKSWCSLISDPQFVKTHLSLFAYNKRLIFLIGYGYGSFLKTCSLNDELMAGSFINNALEVVDYPLKSDTQSVRVVGSCNGLLCLRIFSKNGPHIGILFIWNPSTRKYHKLPSDAYTPSVIQVVYGFGYDDSTDDFKVVCISLKSNKGSFETFTKIYSLRSEGWKVIGAFPQCRPYGFGKFVNGALHWLASDDAAHRKIISLDLATETFREVMQPLYDKGNKKRRVLGTLGGWLCVLCDYYEGHVDLWVMKIYGVKDSWTKLGSVPYMPDLHVNDHFLMPLCISNDARILFTVGKKMIIYDPKGSSSSEIQTFDKCVEVSTFVESLVSPMPPAAVLEHRVAGSNG